MPGFEELILLLPSRQLFFGYCGSEVDRGCLVAEAMRPCISLVRLLFFIRDHHMVQVPEEIRWVVPLIRELPDGHVLWIPGVLHVPSPWDSKQSCEIPEPFKCP